MLAAAQQPDYETIFIKPRVQDVSIEINEVGTRPDHVDDEEAIGETPN